MLDQLVSCCLRQLEKYQRAWEITQLLREKLTAGELDQVPSLVEAREGVLGELKPLVQEEASLRQALAGGGQLSSLPGDGIIQELKGKINTLISQILAQDEENRATMTREKERLAAELRKIGRARQVQKGYEQAYQPDALFFDGKK